MIPEQVLHYSIRGGELQQAIGEFEQSIRSDPRFRGAYEELALTQWMSACRETRENAGP